MTFGDITDAIKHGKSVRRISWRNSSNPHLWMKADAKQEYFIMYDTENSNIYAKQAMLHLYDLLANDWEVLNSNHL